MNNDEIRKNFEDRFEESLFPLIKFDRTLRGVYANETLQSMWEGFLACAELYEDKITQLQDAQDEIKSYDDSGRKQWHSERMQQLEQRLAEAEKVVEFYANENSWFRLKKYLRMDIIDPSDVDDSLLDEGKAIGGIKAREYLAKYRGDV